MSSAASIPLWYSSMNGSNFTVKTGFLHILNDLFVLAKVLVIRSYLYMPTDNILTLTSDMSSAVNTATWYWSMSAMWQVSKVSPIYVSSIIDKSNIHRWWPIIVANDSMKVDWNGSCELHKLTRSYSLVSGVMRVIWSVQLAPYFVPFCCVATSIRAISTDNDPLSLVTIA